MEKMFSLYSSQFYSVQVGEETREGDCSDDKMPVSELLSVAMRGGGMDVLEKHLSYV